MSLTTTSRGSLWRSRWAALGAAVAVSLGAGGLSIAGALTSSPSSFTPVTPVRVFDTRTGTGGVPVAPVGPGGQLDVTVGGTNGIPTGATAVVLNVTVVDGTASSFLTVWPTGDARPTASSLNWTTSAATPNAVTVGLGTGGKVSFYNLAGTVNVLADVVGYYTPAVATAGTPTGFGVFASGIQGQTTAPSQWDDVLARSITFPEGDILVRVGGEFACTSPAACSVRVLLDGVELEGAPAQPPIAAAGVVALVPLSMDRAARNVTAGAHVLTIQIRAQGAGAAGLRNGTAYLQQLS
jgi:hypothetical protein